MPVLVFGNGSGPYPQPYPFTIAPGATMAFWFSTGNYADDTSYAIMPVPLVTETNQVMVVNQGMSIAGGASSLQFTADFQCFDVIGGDEYGVFVCAVSQMP